MASDPGGDALHAILDRGCKGDGITAQECCEAVSLFASHDEQFGIRLAEVLRGIFDDGDLGLSAEQRKRADRIAARHLQAAGEE